MTYDVVGEDGSVESLPLFPGIKENTQFHKFFSQTGILNSTQFTQPALTLLQKAAYEDMRSKGLIQQGILFSSLFNIFKKNLIRLFFRWTFIGRVCCFSIHWFFFLFFFFFFSDFQQNKMKIKL